MDLTAVLMMAVSIPAAALLTRKLSSAGPLWVAAATAAAVGVWSVLLVQVPVHLPAFAVLAAAWGPQQQWISPSTAFRTHSH